MRTTKNKCKIINIVGIIIVVTIVIMNLIFPKTWNTFASWVTPKTINVLQKNANHKASIMSGVANEVLKNLKNNIMK